MQGKPLRLLVCLIAAFALAGSPVMAASPSPAKKAAAKKKEKLPPPGPFDGLYRGVLTPAPALSKHPCAGLTVDDFEIDRGRILYIPGFVAFEGTVTAAGFASGVVHTPGEGKAPLQGRITTDHDGTHLRAGVIDDAAGCAWTMDVKKQ